MDFEPLKSFAPIAISAAALLVSVASFWISYANHRRQVRSGRPVASAAVSPVKNEPDWYRVDITFANRSSVAMRIDTCEIRRPRGALAIMEAMRRPGNDINARRELHLDRTSATRTVAIGRVVAKFGSVPQTMSGMRLSPGDTHRLGLFVSAPRSRLSATVKIRLTARSMEEVERETVIDIIRTLPQATSTASASTSNSH